MQFNTNRIFNITENNFETLALEIFNYQYLNCEIYQKYIDSIKIIPESVKVLQEIPFLPISFFKSHKVISTSQNNSDFIFTSSGTSGQERSKHFVEDVDIYERSFSVGFQHFYGLPQEYCIIALLPGYLERQGSSLIYMMDKLIKQSNHAQSGFYLYDIDKLLSTISDLQTAGQKTLFLGVSYALLDLAEKHSPDLSGMAVMETGGMKGRRKELIRRELHELLISNFNVEKIHSEYGMTELLSQAYSKGSGIFNCPPWMRVLVRDIYDPRLVQLSGKGGINVIDLANINSCSFIETQDLGNLYANGSFEINGRFDVSDIRGCNLLI